MEVNSKAPMPAIRCGACRTDDQSSRPAIDVIWTDVADPHTPMGAHGVGEIGITGTTAAVANAVYNATGKRIRDLPITLAMLL
jgi:CO/xanthine dehydrogenase Mo-binding subunit